MKLICKNGETLEVELVKNTTQKGKDYLNRFFNSECYSLDYAYKYSYSRAKERAFEEIREEERRVNGSCLCITGAGSCFFSCAYQVRGEDNETYVIFHTPSHRFAILSE